MPENHFSDFLHMKDEVLRAQKAKPSCGASDNWAGKIKTLGKNEPEGTVNAPCFDLTKRI